MKAFDKQVRPKTRAPEFNRRIESALGLSRGDPASGQDYISSGDQGRFSVIGQLESSVSMLQTAKVSLEKLKSRLSEMQKFLQEEGYQGFKAKIPVSVINNFLNDRLAHMKMISETSSFQGKALLNGKSGVKGQVSGDNIRFVRGSARVVSSEEHGYPLAISQSSLPATLTGSERISPQNLSSESIIALAEGSYEIRYRIKRGEDADSLVANLQQCIFDHGLDISVYRTRDNRLFFRHNQLGSANHFKGMSHDTRLVSYLPGKFRQAEAGKDVSGTIGSEQAQGDGGYLIGKRGNAKTDGLVVYYDGSIDYPGQIVGYVRTSQNGVMVPLDVHGRQAEILSIPSVLPEFLAIGVSNRSGFTSLGSIRADTVIECRDALKLIIWSITYLDYLAEELRRKENIYVERAVELLRSTMNRQSGGKELICFSQEKAKTMVEQLKTMLTPAMIMKVSVWS